MNWGTSAVAVHRIRSVLYGLQGPPARTTALGPPQPYCGEVLARLVTPGGPGRPSAMLRQWYMVLPHRVY